MGGVRRDPFGIVELVDGPWEVDGWAEAEGMDRWLDGLETLFTAIRQRRMTTDQLDRYSALLLGAEKDALARGRKRSRRERVA